MMENGRDAVFCHPRKIVELLIANVLVILSARGRKFVENVAPVFAIFISEGRAKLHPY